MGLPNYDLEREQRAELKAKLVTIINNRGIRRVLDILAEISEDQAKYWETQRDGYGQDIRRDWERVASVIEVLHTNTTHSNTGAFLIGGTGLKERP